MLIITTQCFPPQSGGIESLMYSLARSLTANGYDIHVLADGAFRNPATGFDIAQSFHIQRFGGPKPWRRRKKAAELNRRVKQNHCRGIIADSWKSLELLNPVAGVPVLCLAHGTELPAQCSAKKTHRIMSSLAKATAIIANSNYTAGRLETFSISRNKINVIFPGIDVPEQSVNQPELPLESTISGKGPVLVSVARLAPRKGIDTIIRLMPRLKKRFPGLIYLILGDGSQRTELEALARDLGVTGLYFLGGVQAAVRNRYLEAADLFVLPGKQTGDDVEGFGIAYIEAAWFGLPAIAGNSGGAPEAVINGVTGLTCNGDNDSDVYTAICRLLDDASLRTRMGENAKTRAREFLWTETIKKYEALLEK